MFTCVLGPVACCGGEWHTRMSRFRSQHTFEKRSKESTRITSRYPDRIPVICESAKPHEEQLLDKQKYLVPSELTFGQFAYVLRKRMRLIENEAIFVFVGGALCQPAILMQQVYDQHKDDDGFLYMQYSKEDTFGAGLCGAANEK